MIIAVNLPIEAIGKQPEKIRAPTEFELVTSSKSRCDALPTELQSHTLVVSSYLPVRWEMMRSIYEIIHI